MIKVFIRADASIEISSGHIMRCLTLAQELIKENVSVVFISRKHNGNLNHLILRKGFEVIELEKSKLKIKSKIKNNHNIDDYSLWLGVSEMRDAQDTINALNNDKPDWMIVDHYALGKTWENYLRPYVSNIMVIDDLANRQHDCDILLDHNWFENLESRYEGILQRSCTKLLGPQYALLRPEFTIAKKTINIRNDKIKRIFIFFGGSDRYNLTSTTLMAINKLELSNIEVDVVIGDNNPYKNKIQNIAESRSLTNVHIQVDDIASIMANADIAIGSGGANTWERICLELFTLIISFSDNHKVMLKDLDKNGFVEIIGSMDDIDENIIMSAISNVINNQTLIYNKKLKLSKLVDGNGVYSVVNWLIGNLSNQYWEVKDADENDMELYWLWANDTGVRNYALKKQSIPWENHVKWFKSKLEKKNCSLYLILADKKAVGQVRFEKENDFARIDYSIAKQFRGRKLGRKVLELAIQKYNKYNSIKIQGEVLPENIASAKIFESLGFSLEIKEGNKVYTKQINELGRINA